MLLRFDNVSLAFGARPLLDHVSLQVAAGDRICLVGRNGEGKSSLLKLARGEAPPDEGIVWVKPGARMAYLVQDIIAMGSETVAEVVAGGLPELGQALHEYHQLAQEISTHATTEQTRRLTHLQSILDAGDGWQLEQRVITVMTRLQLDSEACFAELSGGWRRRALLARALVCEPEILLLDEPTNHLDIEAIEWLEQALREFNGALLFVSHDRSFVNRLATRIIELDRGQLFVSEGNYETYVEKKTQLLAAEAQQAALFDKKLAQEEVWIRRGVEARRTRNEGRVRALHALREQHRQRRERVGRIEIGQQDSNESGKLVCEAEQISLSFGERKIISDFSVRIMRGDRIGIVGPNGAGKSTLIKLLLGELTADSGTLKHGSKLEVAYFDQQRDQLKLDESVMDNVVDSGEFVTVNGQPRHVTSYLRDFLFRPEQLKTPARALSGGERNRLLLARLFAKPANLLVMDEPTNDLDIDTLELLEEFVTEFPGTLLLVSHDRTFLDNVVTDLLILNGSGHIEEFVGGYSEYVRYRDQRAAAARSASNKTTTTKSSTPPIAKKPQKFSYKDQREFAELPAKLEKLEAEQVALQATMSDPQFYNRPQSEVQQQLQRVAALTTEIEQAYSRWSELDSLQASR
ncbi:MAG: ATP-binding cassette domain-containing protein [Steroidobacteraceae bacterium]